MSLAVAVTVFALLVPAELPDKTMIATIVLSTRFPPLMVWLGVTAGFGVQSIVAVAAGGLVSLLPDTLVHGVTSGMFAIGAILLLRNRPSEEAEEREVDEELADEPAQPSSRRAFFTSFAVLVAAEWGDLSQILTANFAAKYGDPVAVFVGAWVGLSLVAGVGVVGGRALVRVVPLDWVRRLAAAGFATMAVVTGLEAGNVL